MNYKTSSTIARRLNAIESVIDIKGLRILEYGPFDRPTFIKGDHDVYYVDYSHHEDVANRYDGQRRKLDDVVPVDFQLNLGPLRTLTSGPFDLFVANHVIEHIPDMIGWLLEAESLAAPSAYMSLIVPDKRNTFDFQRENTDVIELVRNHSERLLRPSAYQVMRHHYYHRSVQYKTTDDFQPCISLSDAATLGAQAANEYLDAHCNVFTRESFIEIFRQLRDGGLTKWKMDKCKGTASDSTEFHAILQL